MNNETTDSKDLISIIMATYNRSNVLKYSIQSVLDQTYENWELIVIGDHCTDDTDAVVASFNNSKIRFVNLERNCGDQSGPNNAGLQLAKGTFVAFLNHDDLWFPDHLELLHSKIANSGADFVYSLFYPVPPKKDDDSMPVFMNGKGTYDLTVGVPASAWLFQAKLYETIGPWKYFREIYDSPSQNWLRRVHAAKKKIDRIDQITMVAIYSGGRKNSYSNRDYLENELYSERIQSSPATLRNEILTSLLILYMKKNAQSLYHLKSFLKNFCRAIVIRFGVRPNVLKRMPFIKRKGDFVNELRAIRGLNKIQ